VTEQPQTPEQQDTTAQESGWLPAAGEPEAPVAPPPPTVPLEPSSDAPAAPPAPPTAVAAPPLGAPVAAVDGSPASGVPDEHPEVLAGAAFAGGFLLALILKRLAD